MAVKSFTLCPNHVHTYVSVKEVEIVQVSEKDELGTVITKEPTKTGKPE